MASFQTDEWGALELQLLQSSAVHLFWQRAGLEEAVNQLVELGYNVIRLNTVDWVNQVAMHEALAIGFNFPFYYGKNLDALNDCLGDVARYEYGADRRSRGTLLVLDGFNSFALTDKRIAHAVLDIWATQARVGLLHDHRMMCFVQSDDPAIEFDPVGASPVLWNPREWLNSARGL